ncbi:unnamed protein product, partial [Urochloa humidicola]
VSAAHRLPRVVAGRASPASAVRGFAATLRQNLDDEDNYDKQCKIFTADVLCSLTQKKMSFAVLYWRPGRES